MPDDDVCPNCGNDADELHCADCGLRGCYDCMEWCGDEDDDANGDWFCQKCLTQ